MTGEPDYHKRIKLLEDEVGQLKKINNALMNRIERQTDNEGSSYSLFESNLVLQSMVKERTERLEVMSRDLQQHKFLKSVIESLTHPFYVIDAADYKVIMGNSASGFDESLKGITCYELTHKRDTPCGEQEHICPVHKVKQTKKPATAEHTHYNEGGDLRYFEVHGYPVLDSEGNVGQIIEYSLDMSVANLG